MVRRVVVLVSDRLLCLLHTELVFIFPSFPVRFFAIACLSKNFIDVGSFAALFCLLYPCVVVFCK